MDFQNHILNQISSDPNKKMKMNNNLTCVNCSVGDIFTTKCNLDMNASNQQSKIPLFSAIGGKKRSFEDSLTNEQQVKRSKICLNNTLESSICCFTYDTFINSKDINVYGTFQLSMVSQSKIDHLRKNKTDDMCTSFQSLSMSKETVNQNTSINETLFRSIDIETRCTYQAPCSDLNLKAVNSLFHGIEAMVSLDCGEFNSIDMSDNTEIPEENICVEYQRKMLWTTAQDELGYVTECKTVDASEEIIDDYLDITNSILDHGSSTSVEGIESSELDSYKCGMCYSRFCEFSQLMAHDCLNLASGLKPLPLTNCTSAEFFTSTRKDLAAYLTKVVKNGN